MNDRIRRIGALVRPAPSVQVWSDQDHRTRCPICDHDKGLLKPYGWRLRETWRVAMEPNPGENRIRALALARAIELFVGHDAGARALARAALLIEPDTVNDIEPRSSPTCALDAIAQGQPARRLDELLPEPFACAR